MLNTMRGTLAALLLLGSASLGWAMPNDPDTTPGNEGFCQGYAKSTSDFVRKVLAQKPSCMDVSKGVHADYEMHLSWCRYTPQTEVEGAARHIRDLANRCIGVARPVQNSAANTGCPAPGSARSPNSNRAAVLNIANSTGRTLKIYWLDFQGQRQFYRELKTGQDYRQPTFVNHLWIAVDGSGKCVDGIMKASRPGDNLMEVFGDD